jgi:predicted alpha/beta-fold hydrolase
MLLPVATGLLIRAWFVARALFDVLVFGVGLGPPDAYDDPPPCVRYIPTQENLDLVFAMPTLRAGFRAPWPVIGPFAQTLWAFVANTRLFPGKPRPRREVVRAMDDGARMCLDWFDAEVDPRGVIVLSPGIGGSTSAPVLRPWVDPVNGVARRLGCTAVVWNRRDHVRLPASRWVWSPPDRPGVARPPSWSDETDVVQVVQHVAARLPGVPVVLVGFSAGAPHVLRAGARLPDEVAGVVAVAFAPDVTAQRAFLRRSALIDLLLMELARGAYARSIRRAGAPMPHRLSDLDLALTASRAQSLGDYDADKSSLLDLAGVRVKTLCLFAGDDPIIEPGAIDRVVQVARQNPCVIAGSTPSGGHHGWVDGTREGWGNRVAEEFVRAVLAAAVGRGNVGME